MIHVIRDYFVFKLHSFFFKSQNKFVRPYIGPVETNNNLEYARLFDDLAVCEINLLILVCHREIKK